LSSHINFHLYSTTLAITLLKYLALLCAQAFASRLHARMHVCVHNSEHTGIADLWSDKHETIITLCLHFRTCL